MVDPDTLTRAAREGREPSDLTPALRVLWLDAAGDWDGAHDLASRMGDKTGSRLHAYLHRVEGDLANAGYWYRRAGETAFEGSLDEEWRALVERYR